MITSAHKTQRISSASTYLERGHKDDKDFLNHIVLVTGVKIWDSFVDKAVTYTHSPNYQKKLKQTSSACQEADGKCFLGQERSVGGGIHAARDHNNVRSVFRNTNECLGPFKTKDVEY
jgi:hypothetical protein